MNMHYPFYRHADIKILYIFIGIFTCAFFTGLAFLHVDIWTRIIVSSAVGIFALLIVLIGHELMILMLDRPRKR